MKKTLEDELMSLAHKILRLRGKEDLEQMKTLTGELYEKLSVLAFAEKHFSKPQPSFDFTTIESTLKQISKEDLVKEEVKSADLTTAESEVKSDENIENNKSETAKEEKITSAKTEIEKSSDKNIEKEKPEIKNEEEELENLSPIKADTSTVDLKDSSEIDLREISVHYDDLPQFEPVSFEEKPLPKQEETINKKEEKEISKEEDFISTTKENSIEIEQEKVEFIEESEENLELGGLFSSHSKVKRKSLNQRLQVGLSFGLNDRLAFINNLFDGNADDFNRVISQLNSFENYSEAMDFIQDQVKPDYDWESKESYEERFLNAIEQKLEH